MTDVRVQRVGDVDVVTIDRPEVRNALRYQSYDELERAVRGTTARCLVITGSDPAFCSGDDVREVMGGGTAPAPTAVRPRLTPAAGALLYSDVPIVAAVNGAAVGWGMELALMADLRVAPSAPNSASCSYYAGCVATLPGSADLHSSSAASARRRCCSPVT